MDSGRPKSLNSEDSASCRISMYDGDDDDEDSADRVGIIDYCLPPKTSNGTASSTDNYSLNTEKLSPRSIGSPCNDSPSSSSYAKAQFEKQVAARDAIDQRLLIDRFQHLFGFGGSERGEAMNSENDSELEKTVAKDDALDSLFQADDYNELIHKNNSEVFDEELSCESDEPEHVADESCCDVKDEECRMEFDEPCCDVEDERRIEYNALVHKCNSEQFDEVLWIESDDDVGKPTGIPQRSYYPVDEKFVALSNSEPMELLADSFLDAKASRPMAGTNGYDVTSQRRAYSSKYSSGGGALSAVDRCSNLLSSCGYMGGRSSMMDFEKKREQPRPLVCSDQEGEADASCGVGNYQAIQSDDSDDSTRFCEQSSELNLPQHQPFFSRQQDDFRSEGGTGDWLFRGNPLHSSGLRGYGTPQYHLTRYGFSSDMEQPSLASSRYYQLRQRRQSKRERQDAAVVNSTDVPGYKGNLGVEELLSYINDDSNSVGHNRSEGHGGVVDAGRSAEKGGRRRKKGSKGSEKLDRTDSGGAKSTTDRRTGGGRVDSSVIKTNQRARIISVCKLMNCVDAVSDDDETIASEQKVGDNDELSSQTIGDEFSTETMDDSDLALQTVVCDNNIPQGNMDSNRTVTIDDEALEKFLAPSSSFPVLRATSADFPLQRAASTEDDFTMVTKKKKSKKSNSKRGKPPPRSDCLPCVPVSSDSIVSDRDFVSPLTAVSKESASFSGYHTKTRSSGALSKSSSAFRSSVVDKTVNNDRGFCLDVQEDDWLADEIETEVANAYGTVAVVVPAVTAVQSTPAAAPESGGINTDDSLAGRSNFLSSQGKPTLQSREKPEPTVKDSLESVAKEVTEEKRRNSKRPLVEKSKDLSVENLEMSASGWQQNASQNDVTKPQSLSQDENTKPRQLFEEEKAISENMSQDEEVISGNMSLNEKVISGNLYQDDKIISGDVFQVEEVISGNLSQDIAVTPHNLSQNEEVISQTLVQDEAEVFELAPQQQPPQYDMPLAESPSQYKIPMYQDAKAEILSRYKIYPRNAQTSQLPFPVDQSLPRIDSPDNSLFSAQAASASDAFDTHALQPLEQPVVFLDRQRRLFSVPAKRDLGLKFGHFDDCESVPDESRGTPTPPYPGPVNVIHFIPVPYNHEDGGGGQDKPLPDSNSMMYPIPHQYLPQLMYANGPLQPLCKPAFQVYPNGHLFPVPMQFAPFVPPGFCVLPPHTTNVPVGVVSPTLNNRPRDETLPSECADGIPIIMDGGDSCVSGFPPMQGIVAPTEPIVVQAPTPLPVSADTVLASVSRSSSRRSKSAFNVKATVEYIYSEWLNVIRREHGPNGGVVRYNPELDL